MRRDLQKSRQKPQSELFDLEEALQSTMKPVDPSQAFIKDMRRRLVRYKESGTVVLEDRSLPFTLWILAGVVSGVVLLLICIRSMMTMLNSGDRSRPA
jgi:hypothetical protein